MIGPLRNEPGLCQIMPVRHSPGAPPGLAIVARLKDRMTKPVVLITAWLPDGILPRLVQEFPEVDFVDGRDSVRFEQYLPRALVTYGPPPVSRLAEAVARRWIQL